MREKRKLCVATERRIKLEDNIIFFGRREMMSEPMVMPSRPRPNPKNNFGTTQLDRLPLTMVYVPMQPYGTTYEPEQALTNGTLFPSIDKPFMAARKR